MIGFGSIDERLITTNMNKENIKPISKNEVCKMISENLGIRINNEINNEIKNEIKNEDNNISISEIKNIWRKWNIYMYKITYSYDDKNYEIFWYSKRKNQIDWLFVFEIWGKKLVLSNYLTLSKESFNKFLKFYNNENNINENDIIDGNVQYIDDYIKQNSNKIEVQVFTLYKNLTSNKPFLMIWYNVISDISPFWFKYFNLNLIKEKWEKNITPEQINYLNKTNNFSDILKKIKNDLEAKEIDWFNNIFSNNNIYLKYALVFYNIWELRLNNNLEEERKKKEYWYWVLGNTYINKDYIKENILKDNKTIDYNNLDYIDIIYPKINEKYIFEHKFIYPKENLFFKNKYNQITIRKINNIVNNNIFLNKDNIELILDTSKIYNLLNNGVKIEEINNFKKYIKENHFNNKLKKIFNNELKEEFNNNKNNNFGITIRELIKKLKQEFKKEYQIKKISSELEQYIYNHIKVVSKIKKYKLKNIITNINQQNKTNNTFIIRIVNVDWTEKHIVVDNNKMFYTNFLNKNNEKDKYKEIFSVNPVLSYLLKYNNRWFIFIPTEHYLNKHIKNMLNRNNKYTKFLGNIANTNTYETYENTFKNINIIYGEKEINKNKIITSYKRLNIDWPFFEKDDSNVELNEFILDKLDNKLDKNIILNKVKKYIMKVDVINNKENPYYKVLPNLFKNTAFQIELTNIFIDNLLSNNIL